MGRNISRANYCVLAISILMSMFLLSEIVANPHSVFAMGSSYEDCAGHNLKKINTIASQSLQLTKKVQYEARKYPVRLKKTISVVGEIQNDLNRVKNLTAYRIKTTDYVVRSEMDRFMQGGIAQRKEFNDVMELLFSVFRESIEEQNADKQYWLNKLSEMNKIGETLGDYLTQLNDAVIEINEQCEEPKRLHKPQYKLQEKSVPEKSLVPSKPAVVR